MKGYIPIMTAENTLKGMSLSNGQRGELLFFVMAESKLNNPLIIAWETLYHILQNNIKMAELTNTSKNKEDFCGTKCAIEQSCGSVS
jgi:hypothetical protein